MKIPEQYADRPNLWRAACELSKLEDPYEAIDRLLAVAWPLLKEEAAE